MRLWISSITWIACALLLLPVLALADSSVPRPATAPAASKLLCVQLHTGLAERSARDVEWQASLRPLAGRASVRKSVLRVRDAAGRVVFADERAFFGGDAGPPWDIALGMSTNAGPTLPALPPGGYAAVWTVDGADSLPARFTIGAAAPPPLAIEWTSCACGAPVTAHLYNPGPDAIDILEGLEKSILIVDGKRYPRQGIEWDGNSRLPARRSWSVGLAPGEYGATLTPGDHSIELELAGRRARLDHIVAAGPSGCS